MNNIVISGIPKEVEHKDLEKPAIGVINACLEKPINERDMEACHRISTRSDDVVCRLVNRKDVEEALDNWRKLKNLNKRQAGLPPNTAEIYISTHLTPYRSKIAYHCRQLKKEGKIKKNPYEEGYYQSPDCWRRRWGNLALGDDFSFKGTKRAIPYKLK